MLENLGEPEQRQFLYFVRLAIDLRWTHQIPIVTDRIADQLIKTRMCLRRNPRCIAAQETPQDMRILSIGHANQVEKHGEGYADAACLCVCCVSGQHLWRRRIAQMYVPNRIVKSLLPGLARICREK